MRGRDSETGEFLGASRSQQRREALDVLELAETLTGLPGGQLAALPIPEELLPHLNDARRITSHIAKKRQIAFLAKQMRRQDDEALDAIRDALDAHSEGSKRQVADMHRAEEWRLRLIEGGDDAMAAFVDTHPDADRQRLRQLVRNAKDEAARNKPPRAFRELFREIRSAFEGGNTASHDFDADVADDDSSDA
ncbi:ribosome biogenesis factor YjgA [Solilutibacter silvestris]|uniref:ribosome biogenesis factor YjgA n=1 Tax=Solilutibacter silvestris TaxID=1645665 RepID=UPI003D34B5C4